MADSADAAASARPSWWLVAGLSVGQTMSWGALYVIFPLYVAPMQESFDWSRTTLNGAVSLGLLVWGVAAFAVGPWLDRFGARGLMTLGSVLGSLALIAWSQVESVVAFYALWALLGIAMSMVLAEPAFAVIVARFRDRTRRAITVLSLVSGMTSAVFIPLTQFLIVEFGWRDSLLAIAALNLLLGGALHYAVVPRGQAPAPVPRAGPAVTNRQAFAAALRFRAFWGLLIWFVAYQAVNSALTFHFIPMMAERAIDMAHILVAVAAMGPIQVGTRIALMLVGGDVGVRQIGVWLALSLPVSLLALTLLPAGVAAMMLFALLYSLGNGLMAIMRGTAVAELIGLQAYGTINGAIAGPSNFARAVAPLTVAALWTALGQDAALWIMIAIGLVGLYGCALAVRSRPPVR